MISSLWAGLVLIVQFADVVAGGAALAALMTRKYRDRGHEDTEED